jgi:rhamnogalacturonyl hydrolase YesR
MFRFTHFVSFAFLLAAPLVAQTPAPGPAAAPTPAVINSGRTPPNYPTPYAPASPSQIKAVLDRVLGYLDAATPVKIVDRDTHQPAGDLAHLPPHATFAPTDFRLVSYEWGVTYSGMLRTAAVTGDKRYHDYVAARMQAIAALAANSRQHPSAAGAEAARAQRRFALRSVLNPRSLDDSGAMCAAMILASRAGIAPAALRPWIDNYMHWISVGQFRFSDGTLARNRPMPDTLWLDDLYMSVPALAQMGVLTGETRYFDDAVKQIRQFAARMFVPEKGLWLHGWVQTMDPHPAFHWARANGWAVVAMTELLDVLPENHPGRAAVLDLYRAQVRGLAACQDRTGLWHQLLDRRDSYLETSASAMFVYAIAHGINRGWLDRKAYGPMVSLGWNAAAQKVNATGQVEGTCVGTGLGFDPAFYYYRPVSVYAAHGYGPLLLAGSEMIALREGRGAQAGVRDGGVHFAPAQPSAGR